MLHTPGLGSTEGPVHRQAHGPELDRHFGADRPRECLWGPSVLERREFYQDLRASNGTQSAMRIGNMGPNESN